MRKTRVFVAGHNGMVGSAIVNLLLKQANVELVLKLREELDLTNQQAVTEFFQREKVDQIYLAAGKVGGIIANEQYPAEFIYQNIMIQCNIIHSAHLAEIDKLLVLGSSCIYPKFAKQPISESELLTGKLEPTNEPYAIAKIAGLKLCESYSRQYGHDYRSVMPTNLYGKNDNFHVENSHVIPGLIRRFHQAKVEKSDEVIVWGTGKAKREFLNVEDMAAASIFIMDLPRKKYKENTQEMLSHINVGTGEDCSIGELVEIIAKIVGYNGSIVFDHSKPDGAPRKLLDVSRLKSLGWQNSLSLEEGLRNTYQWYLSSQESIRE
ncbi:MAG: GDP-L-fucose synthase [Alteromonadaceae bacterium]|nr:GDP-L-fucose synthase [Alteromonadaceae bacterium]